MIFPKGAAHRMTAHNLAAEPEEFDAVIVGTGISGAVIALELSQKKKRVLMIEAGPGEDITLNNYLGYVERFYGAFTKDSQAPYPVNNNAPYPRGSDVAPALPGRPFANAYMVQNGPFVTDTTYTRVLGGTTMHWEAKILRLLPEDFETRKRFGHGLDWPITYDELVPFYEKAEREIGVSAEVSDQKDEALGISYPDGYCYPMHGLPLSYLDTQVDKGIRGTTVDLFGKTYTLKVTPFPQGRNGIPNAAYDGGKGFQPVGAVSTSQVEIGGRCQGNNNCVPICPVQAKYHSGKTLAKALQSGYVQLITQAVASRVLTDSNGRVTGIEFKQYKSLDSTEHTVGLAKGKIYVIAANAIETPRLLLASGLQTTNGLVGRNLMDHAYLLSWARMPVDCGTMRGTNSTGGIVTLRGGEFRKHLAAFSVDIHNDGWGWATGAPYSDLIDLVDNGNLTGRELREAFIRHVNRQLLLAFMIEMPPSESNRVSIDPAYTDALGNMRPVISFSVPEYSMRGAAYGRQFARTVFQRLGASDFTEYSPQDIGYVDYDGAGYVIRGGNHLAGTHVMGGCAANSVVNDKLQSWEHPNLFLAGGGSMPTIGTANITVTLSALCYRSIPAMLQQIGS
jgi:choline dehydrogenase-like flavoprotein